MLMGHVMLGLLVTGSQALVTDAEPAAPAKGFWRRLLRWLLG